jgi:hypothetical protein
MKDNRDNRFTLALIWIPFLAAAAVLSWTIACGDSSPSHPSEVAAVTPKGDFVAGVTSSLSLTTVVPPEPGTLIHGILLAYDQPCPLCTLVAPGGVAVVWPDTPIFTRAGTGKIPSTIEELNAALQPGQPLRIEVDDLTSPRPIAQTVVVEQSFSTTGTIDRSSADVSTSRQFVLTIVDARAGSVSITYALADDAVIEPFDAAARVYLSGFVSSDRRLIVQLVRPDV